MSLLTVIDGVPLYTTIEEADIYGTQYNLTGHHTHVHNGVTGYMSGTNHVIITAALALGIQNFLTPQQLSLGQFVVTPQAAQAYMQHQQSNAANNTVVVQPQQIPTPTQPVVPIPTPPTQPSQPITTPVTPPTTYTPPPSSGGGGGGGGGY